MTDNEIIKALECCYISRQCEGCPCDFDTNGKTFCRKLGEDILALINRQKAEIERLKAENEGYKHLDTILHTAIDKLTANIKSEAIREFGKFLIDKSQHGMILTADIPDYVKEMTEGK